MRKTVSLLLALFLCLPTALVACGHTHQWESTWSHDSDHHWQACTNEDCDEYVGIEAHSFDGGVVITAATRGESGMKRHTCRVCGATSDRPYTLKTTVSAGEFAAAFDFGENYTVSVTLKNGDDTSDYRYARNGNILTLAERGAQGYLVTAYYALEGGICYQYDILVGADTPTYTQTVRGAMSETEWNDFCTERIYGLQALCAFNLYTYNGGTKTYQAASVNLADGTLTGVSLAFTDGALVACSFTQESGLYTVMLFTYGQAPAVTLPDAQ